MSTANPHGRRRPRAGAGPAPAWRTVVVAAGALGASLAVYVAFGAAPAINGPVREVTAVVTAWLLGLVGTAASGDGALLSAGSVRFAVVPDCTPAGPLLLLSGAILAFPARIRAKMIGLAVGALALTALNFLRLVTLVLIGLARPEALEVAHLVVWQSVMILAAIALWVAWLRRYGRGAPA